MEACQEYDVGKVVLLRCYLALGMGLMVLSLTIILLATWRKAASNCGFGRFTSPNLYAVVSTDIGAESSRSMEIREEGRPSHWKPPSSSRPPHGRKLPLSLRFLHYRLKAVLLCWLILTVLAFVFLLASLDGQGLKATPFGDYPSSVPSQRIVFSFSTTPSRIDAIKPVLDALLNQTLPLDAINVIIPRVFRGREVEIPKWLLVDNASLALQSGNLSLVTSSYDEKIRLAVLQEDLGPASKLLGSLRVETDPSTIIIYGDDDMIYPPMLSSRALHYATKYPLTAIGVEGGWLGPEGLFNCGRSIEFGVRQVSVLGGVGGVVVRRGFYDESDLDVEHLPRSCFLGDDFYLSHILARKRISRRMVYDTCWDFQVMERLPASYDGALSGENSQHPGGPNVENYQKCMKVLGDDVAKDVEFGYVGSSLLSRFWGIYRLFYNAFNGNDIIPC